MLFDSHCHVFDEKFNDDIELVMDKCRDMRLMIVGFNIDTNKLAHDFAYKYNHYYSVGVHPTDVSSIDYSYFDILEELLKDEKCLAIGECGLDYYWYKDNKELQKKYFIKQIELSIKYNMPLIIHVRDAINDAYEILKEYKGKIKGVMHSYSGSYEMAIKFIDLGLLIGLSGPVTFKNAVVPKEVALKVPLEKILIETDCPYLTPHPFRGKRNNPTLVKYTCQEIARIKEISDLEVENMTYKNAVMLFGLEE